MLPISSSPNNNTSSIPSSDSLLVQFSAMFKLIPRFHANLIGNASTSTWIFRTTRMVCSPRLDKSSLCIWTLFTGLGQWYVMPFS
jgi:hypothetical protein